MVQPIGEDHVLFARVPVASDQRRDGSLVGAKAALDKEGILDTLELRHAPLELYV